MNTLKANALEIALKAWSMYALYVSLAVQAADALMPFLISYESSVWVKGTAFIVTALAGYFRLLPQRNLPQEDPKWQSESVQ